MNKILLTSTLLLLVLFAHAQEDVSYEKVKKAAEQSENPIDKKYVESSEDLIKAAAPMMNFLMKYDKENKKDPNQGDFDKMLNQMGIMEEVQNDDSGLTKEDAFNVINAYIKADQGEKIEIDQQKKDEAVNYLGELKKGKQDASKIFEDMIADDNINLMMEKASKELYKDGIRRVGDYWTWYRYEEWEAIVKSSNISKEYKKTPFIKAQYKAIIKDFEETISDFRAPN